LYRNKVKAQSSALLKAFTDVGCLPLYYAEQYKFERSLIAPDKLSVNAIEDIKFDKPFSPADDPCNVRDVLFCIGHVINKAQCGDTKSKIRKEPFSKKMRMAADEFFKMYKPSGSIAGSMTDFSEFILKQLEADIKNVEDNLNEPLYIGDKRNQLTKVDFIIRYVDLYYRHKSSRSLINGLYDPVAEGCAAMMSFTHEMDKDAKSLFSKYKLEEKYMALLLAANGLELLQNAEDTYRDVQSRLDTLEQSKLEAQYNIEGYKEELNLMLEGKKKNVYTELIDQLEKKLEKTEEDNKDLKQKVKDAQKKFKSGAATRRKKSLQRTRTRICRGF